MVAVAATLLITIALAVVIFAIYGRRVSRDPHCRRCGYNLAGLDAPRRCPECGRSLEHRRVIRFGKRRMRRSWLTTGIVTAILASGLITFDLRIQWEQYKPTWLLLAEMRWLRGWRASLSMGEVGYRIRNNGLPDRTIDAAVSLVLARQQNLDRPWNSNLGFVLESARTAGRITDDEWDLYLENGARYILHLTQRAGSIYVDVEPDHRFGGLTLERIWVSSVVLQIQEARSQAQTAWHLVDGPVRILRQLEPGPVTVEVSIKADLVRWVYMNESRASGMHYSGMADERITGRHHTLTGTIHITD